MICQMLNNVPTYYNDVLYSSKAEAKYAEFLDTQVKQGKVKWWKRQVRFQVEGNKRYTVIADFLVMGSREEIHEVKRGYYSSEFIYKSQLWLEQYPSFTYLVVEPTATGWSYTPLQEFIKPYLVTQLGTPKKWKPYEIFLAKIIHTIGNYVR